MRERIAQATRIVVKLGTHVVTRDGVDFALGRVTQLVDNLAQLQRGGRQILLVSSGAVGLGMRVLGLEDRPRSLGVRQACAAAGQGQLIALYTQAFERLGVKVAQVLLTQEDLADADRALCLRTTLLRLIEMGVVPILNENDSVSVRELLEWRRNHEGDSIDDPESDSTLAFGDNDGLSARIAATLGADLLVLLTDVDGVFTANPKRDPSAQRIPLVDAASIWNVELGEGSSGGTGGMASKLEAAQLAADAGVDVLITSGLNPDGVVKALAGEDVGTAFITAEPPSARRRRIVLERAVPGALVVNPGAVEALTQRKASLLPVGVTRVDGAFERGDIVEIRDGSGRSLGRGLVNYDARACRLLAGKQSDAIFDTLGYRGYDALVTRDNLVLADV